MFQLQHASFETFVQNFIEKSETMKPQIINIDHLEDQSSFEKRKLYETFRVLCAFEICSRCENKSYRCDGFSKKISAKNKFSEQIKEKVQTTDVKNLFKIDEASSTASISIALFNF